MIPFSAYSCRIGNEMLHAMEPFDALFSPCVAHSEFESNEIDFRINHITVEIASCAMETGVENTEATFDAADWNRTSIEPSQCHANSFYIVILA